MTPEEYHRFIKEAVYRAMYSGHAMHGHDHPGSHVLPYIYEPREERCVNPEFRSTPKPPPPEKVKLHRGITDMNQAVYVVRRIVNTSTSTPLADESGKMIMFTDAAEAERAVIACRKLVLLFDGKR
jgi:hypothetical protein